MQDGDSSPTKDLLNAHSVHPDGFSSRFVVACHPRARRPGDRP
ncbi:hypothetical protein STIAU_6684, partial [Stigmatella aurantiaca DW4/3-1]